ncbi:SDR family oxidoreductase [Arthrobacter castelli]|uniref:SDR family oxidoreductase n=1 Tax=Arthrobacter castelli TaxID=271431 RepID=UPI00041C5027|nr:SDR family oxidoreductase [Arthrobacter castelli]
MSKIAIIGGHGKIAMSLTRQLAARGDEVLSVFRNPDHGQDVLEAGGTPLVFDVETSDAESLAENLDGFDAVVFAAGGGPESGVERKKTVDHGGSVLSAKAAAKAGVSRFVQVSAISVDEPVPADAGEQWAAYVEAKRSADEELKKTSLDWTILRPGGLTNDSGTGSIQLAEKLERGQVPREDVAATIIAVLDEPGSAGKVWELVGGDTPIAEAVRSLS